MTDKPSGDKQKIIKLPFALSEIPGIKPATAVERGVEKNLIFKTWGGLGDQICAEPTLRFALKTFKECDISLASEHPELFQHLSFKRVFDLKEVTPNWDKYLVFNTIEPPSHLIWQFMSHMLTHCVDFPSICAFRCQLPVADRVVQLHPNPALPPMVQDNEVYIHAGRHWQSKTFPKAWWDAVIERINFKGQVPVLIGADTDDNRGTVDVDASRCVDLRGKLSIMESISALQRARVVLTNDSAPLHMAATGRAWIGFVATCKHPDFITHWREGGNWGWRMQNFGKGGVWDVLDYCPNKESEVTAENVGDHLEKWLPEPHVIADWAVERRA